MLPSEMDNGQSMLDVNIDTSLLNDFFDEDNNGVTSISDVDCGSAFDWADDFISSASTPLATDAVAERSPATSLPSTSPATSVPETQTITSTALPPMAQVVVTAQPGGIIQQAQIPVSIASQTILQKSANIIQGIAPGTQHFVVKTANGQQIQFQQPPQVQPAPGSSPAPAQQFSVPSPAISRSITPSQSPAPSCSPHISRSITPNQSVVHQSVIANPSALSSSSSPNILHIASGQTQQSQVQLTNTVPIQSIIQNPSQNASIIPGQTVIPGHANNIVHTQNAVIQNPNVVNLNVATHVLCGNSQQVGQQTPGQIQNNIQGMPVSVHNPAGIQGSLQSNIQGNPVNLQGTIIQTAQGKILIPNQQLGGHQINLNTMQPQVIQGQQIMSSGGTVIQNAVGMGNVIRLAAQPGQDKTASVVPPNISLVNIGGAQGQQILIQRAPHPAQGQPQNIIFKTLPQNLIQIQGSQTGQANLQGTSLQTASQISQQILNQASSQSVQYQQVLAGSQPQPVKLVSQQGSQLTTQAGAVTLNLAGQNINLQQISGLGTAPVQGIHLQQNGNQYIMQPAQTTQLSAQPQTVNVSSINQTSSAVTIASSVNQSTNIVSKALISAGLGQVINTQIKPGQGQLEPKSSNSASETSASSKSKSKKSKSSDGQVKGSPQQLAQNVQKLQIPISQFIATASNAAGINTAQSTPTTVTTTVSQAVVQIPAQLTVASTLSGSQVVSSVQSKNTLGIMQTSSPQIKIQPNIAKSGPPNVTLCPRVTTTTTTAAEQQRLQKVQMEINKLLSQGNLSQENLQKINLLKQNLKDTYPSSVVPTIQSTPGTVSPQPIKALVQTSVAGQPMVGQPPIAQPQVAVSQVPTIKTEPAMQPVSVQTVVSQPSIVVQPQPAGTGLIQLAVSQPATSGAATQVITSVAQAVQPQYLPKVLKQSPSKNIKVAPAGTTQVIQIQTTPVATSTPTRPALPAGTVIRTPPPGKVPISATPSLPTQIKIANQVLTLNLTSQQKEKLQEHLGRMSMEQQEVFLKQQQHVLLRLQQQQIQQQIQVIRQTSPQTKPQLLVANPPGTIPITVQQIDKGINQIKVGTEALQTNTANRAVKRPAPADIPKGKLIHQQLTKDQQHAVSPDTKSPFKDYKEACRRLLRFHVFQHHGPKEDAFKKAEASFDVVSDDLLKRSHTMMNKYRTLLLEESMRDKPSAEMVMIQRMLNQDLTSVIKKEKEVIKKTPESFVPMPMKYLKKEKEEDKEDSAAETSAIDTSLVKSEPFTESEYSDHEMSESFHHSSASADSEQIKSSPPVPPGKVKLVIRNDGRGFTSSLKAKTPVKTEPPSPLYGQITPEEPCVKVRVKEDPSFMDDFTVDQYADERDDLNMSGERADESGNILSGDLSSVGSDFNATDLQTGLSETSFRAQLGETRVSEPLGDVCELPAFRDTEEDSLLKGKDETSAAAAVVAAASVASAVTDTVSQLNVHQPHYSDISITDVSGEYAGVLSPVHKAIDPEDAVLGDFTSQISQNYDPSAFDFPGELSSGNICSQSVVSPAARSETAQASLNSITIDDGFHHQMNMGGNHLHVTSSPTTPASTGVYEPEDDAAAAAAAAISFTSSARPLSTVQEENPEIDSAVHSIMDFEDVSSDGNITDISQEKGDLGAGALTSKDLPQNEMMFSPGPGDDDMDNDGLELDASFESDTNDPQNQMMNAQMQSAIDSILSLNQGDEQSDSFLDQSNISGYYDNQMSEVTDTSQDESEYCADEPGDGGDRPSGSGEGEGEGDAEGDNDGDGETSMEDDLDAAVQSILM